MTKPARTVHQSSSRYLALLAYTLPLVLLPVVAFAQMDAVDVFDYLILVVSDIIPILVALAVLVFFWGIVKFMTHAGDEKTHEEGKQLMIWGMVGLFVMVGLWSIIGYIQESIGLDMTTPLGDLSEIPDRIPLP